MLFLIAFFQLKPGSHGHHVLWKLGIRFSIDYFRRESVLIVSSLIRTLVGGVKYFSARIAI